MDKSGENYSEDVELEESDNRGDIKGLVKLTCTGGTEQIANLTLEETGSSVVPLDGFKIGDGNQEVKIPRTPSDYVLPPHNTQRDEPAFADIDNPGNWPSYCFRPTFNNRAKTSKYKDHQLPTGAVPFPKRTSDGKRITNTGWEFHYNGWENS